MLVMMDDNAPTQERRKFINTVYKRCVPLKIDCGCRGIWRDLLKKLKKKILSRKTVTIESRTSGAVAEG